MSRICTPWAPSKSATQRVTNPLPLPETCPHCGGKPHYAGNETVYGSPLGDWPWIVACDGCDARVGLHPFTAIPLGFLADAETREARKAAKNALNATWMGSKRKRISAYIWLSHAMDIPLGHTHIGWFDSKQCAKVVALCRGKTL